MIDLVGKIRRLQSKLVQLCLATVLHCSSVAVSCAATSDFAKRCQMLVPAMNTFAQECQTKARPFSRTFFPGGLVNGSGEKESYSVWFFEEPEASHFVLGCVLNRDHSISYLGIYFSIAKDDVTTLNKGQIVFIDPNDDVGIDVSGKRRTLLPIRQFTSTVVPPRLIGRPANCDPPSLGAESIVFDDAQTITYCMGPSRDRICKKEDVVPMTKSNALPSSVIYSMNAVYFITTAGQLYARRDWYDSSCSRWPRDPTSADGILFEACRMH